MTVEQIEIPRWSIIFSSAAWRDLRRQWNDDCYSRASDEEKGERERDALFGITDHWHYVEDPYCPFEMSVMIIFFAS